MGRLLRYPASEGVAGRGRLEAPKCWQNRAAIPLPCGQVVGYGALGTSGGPSIRSADVPLAGSPPARTGEGFAFSGQRVAGCRAASGLSYEVGGSCYILVCNAHACFELFLFAVGSPTFVGRAGAPRRAASSHDRGGLEERVDMTAKVSGNKKPAVS